MTFTSPSVFRLAAVKSGWRNSYCLHIGTPNSPPPEFIGAATSRIYRDAPVWRVANKFRRRRRRIRRTNQYSSKAMNN